MPTSSQPVVGGAQEAFGGQAKNGGRENAEMEIREMDNAHEGELIEKFGVDGRQ